MARLATKKSIPKIDPAALRKLPSVDEVLCSQDAAGAIERFGRPAVVGAVRAVLAEARKAGDASGDAGRFALAAFQRLAREAQSSLRPVFNLTGTVLHTNLGRALLAEQAVEAAVAAMRSAVALEFDVGGGHRVPGQPRALTPDEESDLLVAGDGVLELD